jgi:hypothetical protein
MSTTFKTKTKKPSKFFLSPSRIQLLFQMGGRSKIWETQPGDRRMERNDGRAFGTGHFHYLCLLSFKSHFIFVKSFSNGSDSL